MRVGVELGVSVGVGVTVDVEVKVGVIVGVGLGVLVGVCVGRGVNVRVGVGVGVSVGICVGVGVGVGGELTCKQDELAEARNVFIELKDVEENAFAAGLTAGHMMYACPLVQVSWFAPKLWPISWAEMR